MPAIDINNRLMETYLELINQLGQESKLELIARLNLAVRKPKSATDNSIYELFGAFDDTETAEELIKTVRSARVFNRKIENFE